MKIELAPSSSPADVLEKVFPMAQIEPITEQEIREKIPNWFPVVVTRTDLGI